MSSETPKTDPAAPPKQVHNAPEESLPQAGSKLVFAALSQSMIEDHDSLCFSGLDYQNHTELQRAGPSYNLEDNAETNY